MVSFYSDCLGIHSGVSPGKGWVNCNLFKAINLLHPNVKMHILYIAFIHFLSCSQGEFDKHSKECPKLVIISFILMTFMCNSGLILIVTRN